MKYEGETIEKDDEGGKKGMRGITKFFLGIFITIAIIIIAVGGVFGYFWNATPAKLGIAEFELINGESLESLGLSDVKIKDIIKQFKEITKADSEKIVQNAPTDEDKTSADSNTDKVTTEGFEKADGTKDYSIIVDTKIEYDKQYRIEYSDTTLCYIIDEIINGSIDSVEDDSIDFLKEINATVNEITIEGEGDNATLRVVMSLNVEPLKDKIKEIMGSAYSLIEKTIPKTFYVVSTFSMDVDTTSDVGKLVLTSDNFKLNDKENALTKAVFKIIASSAGADTSATEDEQKAFVNDKIGDAFEAIVYNLGRVGEASTLTDNVANPVTIVYGADGIKSHKITVITYTTIE